MRFPIHSAGKPALVLAPMEGVTDAPMRALQAERGAFTFCVSEFLRVCHLVPPSKVFLRHIPELENGCRTRNGTPVQVQLLGGDPQTLAGAAVHAVALGAHAIDLNFGCPAPTVNRHDGGATLLKYPSRIRTIVAAVKSAVPAGIAVSAKLRLGWDATDPIFQNAEQAALGGADWITIHGRTRMAGYAPPIYWEPIGEVRKQLAPLPIVANGDIWTMEDFRRCRDITGCEHFMLGRGALADPNLPLNAAAELGILKSAPGLPLSSEPLAWVPLFDAFSRECESTPGTIVARRIKQWTGMATRYGQVPWFDRIKRLPDWEAIRAELTAM